jgi:molybdopterin-guanine dinucleotide biosynthesis protein A
VTRLLGAVLAGGQSSRFGSDKAMALLDRESLLAHALAAIRGQCDALVICGRQVEGIESIADRPARDLGPLAGINAALHHARDAGFDAVLTVGCDTPLLPPDLAVSLMSGGQGGYVADLPVIGLWPARLAAHLDAHIASGAKRSIRGWAAQAGVAAVDLAIAIPNINRVADLDALIARRRIDRD